MSDGAYFNDKQEKAKELYEKLIPEGQQQNGNFNSYYIKNNSNLEFTKSPRVKILNKRKSSSSVASVNQYKRATMKSLTSEKKIDPKFFNKKQLLIQNLNKSCLYLLSSLPIVFKHIFNLIFLSYSTEDSFDTVLDFFTSYHIGFILISTLGYDFILGAGEAFDRLARQAIEKENIDTGLLYKIYNEAKIYSFIIFILSTLPFGYSADYILYFLRFDEVTYTLAGNFAKLFLISVFFQIFNCINSKFLMLQGHSFLVMSTNIFVLIIHILCLLCFNYTFNMGITGCAISLIVSSVFEFLILKFYVYKYHPFDQGKDILIMDTSTLQSSKFYIYVKYGSYSGVMNLIKKFTLNFIVLGSYYLIDINDNTISGKDSQDKISLTTNILLVSYIMFVHEIFKSLCIPVKELYYAYAKNYGVLNCRKSERFKDSNLNNINNGNFYPEEQNLKLKDDLKSELNKNIFHFSLKISFAIIAIFSILNYFLNLYGIVSSLFFSYEKIDSLNTDLISNTHIDAGKILQNKKITTIYQNFSFIAKIYSIFIFFDFICAFNTSILKIIHKNVTMESLFSFSLITVFFPFSLILSYSFGFSYVGFWYAYFISLIIYSIIYYYYLQSLDLLKISSKIKKIYDTNVYDEKMKEKS